MQQILGQIGGRDAHRLPDWTVTQLLDLVAWIESFHEKIEDAFPYNVVGKVTNEHKASMESGASLLHGEGNEIDVVRAKESVEWIIFVLWAGKCIAWHEMSCSCKRKLKRKSGSRMCTYWHVVITLWHCYYV